MTIEVCWESSRPRPHSCHLVPHIPPLSRCMYFHLQSLLLRIMSTHWTIRLSNQTFDYESCLAFRRPVPQVPQVPTNKSTTLGSVAPWWGHFSLEDLLQISCSQMQKTGPWTPFFRNPTACLTLQIEADCSSWGFVSPKVLGELQGIWQQDSHT